MNQRRPVITALFLVLAVLAAPLSAHDFWIEPSAFHLAPSQKVALRLRVGEHFRGDPVPRMPQLIERFVASDGHHEAPVPGIANTDPAGFFSAGGPGVVTIVYQSGRSDVALEAEKFESYLAKEGLERISQLRRQRGLSAAPAKEVFSRCDKAFLVVGSGDAAFTDRPQGLPLELVAEQAPFSLAAARGLVVRLLYRGKPLAGAQVVAIPRRQPERELVRRTDAQGRASLPLAVADVWLIKAVHMVEAPQETGAQWESFWAALTFEVAAD
jgi:uncharacterized GH25 family protein